MNVIRRYNVTSVTNMILLILFSFLAGIVTILSPCILPVLPIILSATVDGKKVGRSRPLGIIAGFVLSFTFFTLFLSLIVKQTGIGANNLRLASIIVIAFVGLSALFPPIQQLIETFLAKFSLRQPTNSNTLNKHNFQAGLLVGISLGLLWTPCVGPILASVISLAITGIVTTDAIFITLAYSAGTAIPMLLIMLGGQNLINKMPALKRNTALIQKFFGLVMILMAIALFFNFDRNIQTKVLELFPNYGTNLTKLEQTDLVTNTLFNLQTNMQSIDAQAPEITPGGIWFNSSPLKISDLKGKVVLVDFWTYSCINCQRTFPYLRSWYQKYKDSGLVIIGVHSPEFEFEKDEKNLAKAITDFEIAYPVVQDNDFKTWKAYNNRYWPAKYFIDKDSKIRFTHFGEGNYDESEEMIQKLLKETGATISAEKISNPTYQVTTETPETYLGYLRITNFSSNEPITKDKLAYYSSIKPSPRNSVSFDGFWEITKEYSQAQPGSALILNFTAKKVFLVMDSVGKQSNIKVSLEDSSSPNGKDVQNETITVDEPKLYEIVSSEISKNHKLTLEFQDSNTRIYAFTFE